MLQMCQPADSFVISKIKDAWSARWEAYKLHCIQTGVWQNEVHEDGRVSGMLKNHGKRFFLELAVVAISDVNSKRDGRGHTYAQKAMLCTGLACDVNGEWHIGQLAPKLQEIIRLYPTHSAGALVPILV